MERAPDPDRPRPLRAWSFAGELRHYQADALDVVPDDPGEPLHLVAPPGSGKTILGLLLAVRHGGRAVVLAPTTTIRDQWARTAAGFSGATGGVSEDPRRPADLTALTYQALSVLETGSPLAGLAIDAWEQELVAGGRTEEAAVAWLDGLRHSNPSAHRSGVARRSRALRRRLARAEPETLETVLHPNARALVDRLVAHGVETIVLDECHHLLDHWALVVAYLAARIREAGGTPQLIGLTATLPSTEDPEAYDLYTSLLGDVDYEVPTPAVVREGNLAPYRDAVWFVAPDSAELDFLRRHDDELASLVEELFAGAEGIGFLAAALQPGDGEPAARLAAAFADEFAFAEGASRMLARVAPGHPLVALLPPDALDGPDTEQSIRVLARFALDRILPDADRAGEWERIAGILADFGFVLTDRGIRRGRDPIDTVLASSTAKDAAAAEILAGELSRGEGFPLAAVVVTDFAVHGNRRGSTKRRSGALRCFDVLADDSRLAVLRPVLVTAKHLRIASRDAAVLLPALAEELGVPEFATAAVGESPGVVEVATRGASSADVVGAVSRLVTAGVVRLIVGTRGLLGEGWDCPAINTLVDLTSVATSAATQQLRGRTLRLDPAWPGKVAHNWTVTALVPAELRIDAQPDLARMHRKHGRVWGLERDSDGRIVRGIGIALTPDHRELLRSIVRKERAVTIADLDREIVLALPTRAESYADWRVGEPYADRESVGMTLSTRTRRAFLTGPALELVLAAMLGVLAIAGYAVTPMIAALLVRDLVAGLVVAVVGIAVAGVIALPLVAHLHLALRQTFDAAGTYRRIVAVVAGTLHGMGRLRAFDDADIAVSVERETALALRVEAGLAGGTIAEQRLVATCLEELFGPVRSPRFLLHVNRGAPPRSRHLVLRLVLRITGLVARRERYLPVPSVIGRRRAVAEAFAAAWRSEVGPCRLIELDSPERLALLVEARRHAAGASSPPARRETWS